MGDLRKKVDKLQNQKDIVSEELGTVQVGVVCYYSNIDFTCTLTYRTQFIEQWWSYPHGNGTDPVSIIQKSELLQRYMYI